MGYRKYLPEVKYDVVSQAIEGKSLADINNSLGTTISPDSLYQWKSLYERTRAVVCDPATYLQRGRPFELDADHLEFIKGLVADKPSIYADEIQSSLAENHGVTVSVTTILTTLHARLNMSKKTMRTVHPKQDEWERAHYIYQVGAVPTNCLVFTDKSGVCLEVVQRTRGWAVVGERTPRVPRKRSTHQFNIVPAISTSGLVAHMVQEESMDRQSFQFFLENVLIPSMNPFPQANSVLVMDNAQIHHNGDVADIVESAGCLLLYLPAYSPDLNPIEKAFSVYKSTLKRHEDLLPAVRRTLRLLMALFHWFSLRI